ncbi:MAG: hypothetical protein NZ519_05155 [Bacteroidia bacterium]|nr:hypothetical protein [Bacteroidia bacterium]
MNRWLQTVYGVGHVIQSSNGSIGYYTGKYGFKLTANTTGGLPYEVKRGQQTFSVSDTDGVAAYIYLSGNANYTTSVDQIATVSYPLTLTLVGDAANIEDYANAIAFVLTRSTAIDSVTLNHNKIENLQSAAKSTRRTRNTATGVANIGFTMTIHQGADCLILVNC